MLVSRKLVLVLKRLTEVSAIRNRCMEIRSMHEVCGSLCMYVADVSKKSWAQSIHYIVDHHS